MTFWSSKAENLRYNLQYIFLPHRAKCMKKKLSTEASTSEIAHCRSFLYQSLIMIRGFHCKFSSSLRLKSLNLRWKQLCRAMLYCISRQPQPQERHFNLVYQNCWKLINIFFTLKMKGFDKRILSQFRERITKGKLKVWPFGLFSNVDQQLELALEATLSGHAVSLHYMCI